jgi:hypothetical protein
MRNNFREQFPVLARREQNDKQYSYEVRREMLTCCPIRRGQNQHFLEDLAIALACAHAERLDVQDRRVRRTNLNWWASSPQIDFNLLTDMIGMDTDCPFLIL